MDTSDAPSGPIIPADHPKISLSVDQDIGKKPTDKTAGVPSRRIVLEVFKVNGVAFDGVLSVSDIFEIWECLGRDAKEILQHGYEQINGVCLRIAYNLKEPIQLTEVSTKPEFCINKKGAFKTDVYRIRLVLLMFEYLSWP